jgi:hypothetical protein
MDGTALVRKTNQSAAVALSRMSARVELARGDVGFCVLGKAEDVGFGKVQATSGVEDPTVGAQPLSRAPAAGRGCAARR